jgi:hypothetical protein
MFDKSHAKKVLHPIAPLCGALPLIEGKKIKAGQKNVFLPDKGRCPEGAEGLIKRHSTFEVFDAAL